MSDDNTHVFYALGVLQRKNDFKALQKMRDLEHYLSKAKNVDVKVTKVSCGERRSYKLKKGTIGQVINIINTIKNEKL